MGKKDFSQDLAGRKSKTESVLESVGITPAESTITSQIPVQEIIKNGEIQENQNDGIKEKKNNVIQEKSGETGAPKKKRAKPETKSKVNFYLDTRIIEKLKIAAVKRNIRYSSLIEEAILKYLERE